MKCPYCDNEVPPNVANCPSCGAVVPQQPQYAPPQPQYAPPQYAPPPQYTQPQYIPQQQIVVQVAPQQMQSDKSRVAYILLALFLGGLGIHNFYAGRTGAGVAQLLITLCLGWLIVPLVIVGFWVLLEILVVSTDGQGRRFC